MQFTIPLASDADTQRLGEDLALALKPGDVLALSGDLGAGKSTLARALLRALADDPELEVPSPTFTLVQSYDLRIPASHFDFYRLSGPEELDELGLDETLSDGIALVEWPERAADALPLSRIHLTLKQDGSGRLANIVAEGSQALRIARTLAIRAFLERRGMSKAVRRYLTGDASVRAYEYLPLENGSRLILMDWPRPPKGPPVHDGKPYAEVAHIAQDPWPFIALSQALGEAGFSVPQVIAADCENGILLLDDLGSEGILDNTGAPIETRYREAAQALATLHGRPFAREIHVKRPDTGSHTHIIPDFDRVPMLMEVRLLIDWYLPHRLGREASDLERQNYIAIWEELVTEIGKGEKSLLMRDVHSPNILWQESQYGIRRVGFIDFQDSMIGPSAYDVASLIRDARVSIPPAMTERLLQAYIDNRNTDLLFDADRFRKDIAFLSAQRNCKLAGLWVRLMKRDGKPGYMKHMPRTIAYLEEALTHEALAPLRDWFRTVRIGIGESATE